MTGHRPFEELRKRMSPERRARNAAPDISPGAIMMPTPWSSIATFMLANATLASAFGALLEIIRPTMLDPVGKYVVVGLFLAGTIALFGWAARRLRIGLLFAVVAVSAAANILVGEILSIAIHGTDPPYGKAEPLFSFGYFAMVGIAAMLVAFVYLVLAGIILVVMVRLRIPVASADLPRHLGMETERR